MRRRRLIRIISLFCICFVYFYNPSFSIASEAPIYRDENDYFTFVPPSDWKIEEFSAEYRSRVQCTMQTPEGTVTIAIIAELDNDNLGNLYFLKKEFVDDHKRRFPEGTFVLSKNKLCDFTVLRIEFEISKVVKEELYFFFVDGVRFDLSYGASETSDFIKYKKTALEVLCSIKPQSRVKKK